LPINKENIGQLAYKLYKLNESYEHNCWRLAELVETINENIVNGYDIPALESENLVLMLRSDKFIEPNREKIADLAEIIYHESPEKSKLHWFIAEKTLVLEEIKKALELKKG
jgi:hypothetical protein